MDTNQLNWIPEARTHTVFEEDNWLLVTRIPADAHGMKVSIKHFCGVDYGDVRSVFVFDYDARYCWRCTADIPDGIIGLLRLYNWDQT